MTDPALPPVALRHQRERTIARLCEHFAQDHLEAEELEGLIDRAHRASTVAELDALVSDLPALREAPPAATAAPFPARVGGAAASDQQVIVAIMGGVERKGAWVPARTLYVTAIMGGACLDFREAHLEGGVTEIYVVALMGGVEIVVPPGVHVESNGVGIMGGFEHAGSGKFPVDAHVPVLRITGLALMGGVEIRVRSPGEPFRPPRPNLPGPRWSHAPDESEPRRLPGGAGSDPRDRRER